MFLGWKGLAFRVDLPHNTDTRGRGPLAKLNLSTEQRTRGRKTRAQHGLTKPTPPVGPAPYPTRIYTNDHYHRRLAPGTAAAATAPDLALQQIQKPAHQRTTPPWLDMEASSRILALLTIHRPPLGFRLNNQPPYRGLLLTAYSHHALRPHRNRRAPASH